ncbi:UNVERIFIED_CONTAM: hypothetical protein GTU68_031847 [Idotea baltica]|nr:hypothetical protein [Idotea baltica]
MRTITVEELSGFRNALLELCVPFDRQGLETIDVCGTGGDGKNTFNISTLSAFVIAGAGYKVTKHGNYGVSSGCGSSNVLEHLGYQFTNEHSSLMQQLNDVGICFLHAPLFHPALKSVGPIRRELGMKTFFNMLGPIVNPAQPTHQMVGVFDMNLQRLYKYLFEDIGHKYAIVHGMSGFDEISLTDTTKVVSTNNGEYMLDASTFGLPQYKLSEISGGETVPQAAKIFTDILSNQSTEAQKNVVLANSALAIDCYNDTSDLKGSMNKAKESLESGAALSAFENLIALSNS